MCEKFPEVKGGVRGSGDLGLDRSSASQNRFASEKTPSLGQCRPLRLPIYGRDINWNSVFKYQRPGVLGSVHPISPSRTFLMWFWLPKGEQGPLFLEEAQQSAFLIKYLIPCVCRHVCVCARAHTCMCTCVHVDTMVNLWYFSLDVIYHAF